MDLVTIFKSFLNDPVTGVREPQAMNASHGRKSLVFTYMLGSDGCVRARKECSH